MRGSDARRGAAIIDLDLLTDNLACAPKRSISFDQQQPSSNTTTNSTRLPAPALASSNGYCTSSSSNWPAVLQCRAPSRCAPLPSHEPRALPADTAAAPPARRSLKYYVAAAAGAAAGA
jgi:hypothetical protein